MRPAQRPQDQPRGDGAAMSASALPPVTDAHRHAAFEAMHWAGWTYEAAMAYDLRRRLIELRAAVLRTREWDAATHHSAEPIRRIKLDASGNPIGWCTQMVMGPRQPIRQPDLLESAT